ncbi:uncharacterized protein [Panulirus ornatus]
MSPTMPTEREEMNLKHLSGENVELVISGCSVDERDFVGRTASVRSEQLRSAPSSTKKILPTTSYKIPSSLYGINPQLFLPSRVLNFPSITNKDIDLVRTGRLPTCHSHSAGTHLEEQNQPYYSCCQHCMQSYVPKTLKIKNLYEFNCMSTQEWGNSSMKNNFPIQENSPLLQAVGMGTVVLVGTFYSQSFMEEMSKLSKKSISSLVNEIYIDNKAGVFDNLYSDISCTKVIHESIGSSKRSTKGNKEVAALYHMTADQCTLGFWHFKEHFSNNTDTYKIRPKQRTNSISRKTHTSIIVYTTSPVKSEVLEFRTRYIKASPDPETYTRMKQDKHCRTCKTERFIETSRRSKPRKIMATSASLYFPEPVTRSASLLHIAWKGHIKKKNNDSRTTDKVISLTKPPDIIPEPSTKFICKSDITFHSLDSNALISLFVDYSSIWTTHQILSSASPSFFPEPETFFWYQTGTKLYDPKVPESVTLESSLRSFPDVTLGYTEMHTPMTASWGQHFAS